MKKLYICLLLFVVQNAFVVATPEESLARLMRGNVRYVEGRLVHPSRGEDRRLETAQKQDPFAVILGCSDSRVSPEIIFDQGIGDLFIIRVAGNVVGPIELDSIEFSAVHFNSSIIMVLGHKNCSAVSTVLKGDVDVIENIASLIEPAVVKSKAIAGDSLESAVKMNVRMAVEQLNNNPFIKKLVDEKKVKVVGGYYDLGTGTVELLDAEQK